MDIRTNVTDLLIWIAILFVIIFTLMYAFPSVYVLKRDAAGALTTQVDFKAVLTWAILVTLLIVLTVLGLTWGYVLLVLRNALKK